MLSINSIEFYRSFSNNIQLPGDSKLPEIAFIGRSNVGKSSLINDLCRKKIAKTSGTPGKTQLINFFLLNKSFYLVDLPGYGYAKVSKSLRDGFINLIETYLQTRKQLKAICILLDIRRIPNEQDKILNEWFKQLKETTIIYILTKTDKLSKQEGNNQKIKNALELFVDQKEFIMYSIFKNIGRKDVLNRLDFLNNI